MAKINCPKCGQNSLDVMVDVSMVIPMDAMHELSKKAIRDKRVELWGANWDRSSWFCKNKECLWQKISPLPKWVERERESNVLIDGALETLSAYIDGHSSDEALVQVINEFTAAQEKRGK